MLQIQSYKKNFLDIEQQLLPEIISSWFDIETIKERLKNYIEEQLKFVNNEKFGVEFHKHCLVAGAKASDYEYKLWQLKNGSTVLTSIRFLGGDLNFPFVELVYTDFLITKTVHLHLLAREIYTYYKIFNPKALHLFDSQNRFRTSHPNIRYDLHYVAAPIAEIRDLPFPEKYAQVQLKVANSLDFYSDYRNIFQQLVKAQPAYNQLVRIESREDLNELIKQKTVFNIFIKKQWAGIIAVSYQADLFFKGFYMIEEILSHPFRGKGYAAAVQRQMIEMLPFDPLTNDLIYGTINDKNVPSLKTAFRVGRKSVGKYIFFDMTKM